MPMPMASLDEPTMSDATILVTVEDLIDRAMGAPDANRVNFKLIQAILHILARQQRLLTQRVEIRVVELKREGRKRTAGDESSESSTESSPPGKGKAKSPRSPAKKERSGTKEKDEAKDKGDRKEREGAAKVSPREKELTEKLGQRKTAKTLEEPSRFAIKLTRHEKAKSIPQMEREELEEYEQRDESKMPKKEKRKSERAETMPQKNRHESEEDKIEDYEIASEEEKILLTERLEDKKDWGRQYEETEEITQKSKEKFDKPKEKERVDIEKKKGHKKEDIITPKEISIEKEEKKNKDKIMKMTQIEKENFEKNEKKGQKKAEKISKEEKEIATRKEMNDMRPEKGKLVEKYKPTTEKEQLAAKEPTLHLKKPEQRSSFEITEKIVDSEKILVVENAPTTRTDARSSSSIDVVTQSQFALLQSAVKQLASMAAPLQLQLPDNKQLVSDVMSGAATLPDAMQTLQINSRLQAAESALVRMVDLMTQLAAAGELPGEIVEQMQALEPSFVELQTQADQLYQRDQADKSQPLTGKKYVAIGPKTARSKTPKVSKGMELDPAGTVTPNVSVASTSSVFRVSRVSSRTVGRGVPSVTYEEMKAALKDLRDEILKCLNNMTGRATISAETALHTAKLVAEKFDIALKLDERLSFLHSMVEDYAEQLNRFDSGLSTQVLSFQDQMAQMRADLQAGLLQLENVNNNAETAAVLELTERYDELASELDNSLHAHKALANLQAQLSAEMHSLLECIEMLREEKADRDEVLDGLRDKADSSKLAGLLTEVEFAEARADFDRRVDLCYDKFARQDAVWQEAIKDLKFTMENKSELVELLSMRDDAQRQLQDLNDKIRVLASVLGEPKAALLTRKLAEGGTCGACRERALMEPHEAALGAPRLLPALRPPPVGASEEPCLADWAGAGPNVERHMCHRWCGGSHTLVSESTRRVQATPLEFEVATRKFMGHGDDGRLYMMEVERQPCIECNISDEQPQPAPGRGAGDEAIDLEPLLECTCLPD